MSNVNTENSDVQAISLFDKNDGFFIAYQNGDCGLYWLYDGYLLILSGNITKDEAINLALSTKITEFLDFF